MEYGPFETGDVSDEIYELAKKFLGDNTIESISRICERYGEEESDVRKYDVYKVKTHDDVIIIKKACEREYSNYEKYLSKKDFNVPEYYGKYAYEEGLWIILEYIEGDDLRDMTDDLAKAAAESLASIQNVYWNCPDTERFDTYIERIEKRYSFIKGKEAIEKAYKVFLDRQQTCPRTMSHGDCFAFNAINHKGTVYLIDWGFGGIMPYSLDIARFIAHATENRTPFPFYMNDVQKKIFIDRVYDLLEIKLDYERYLYDIKLALLNEYVEFVEADEDESGWYLEHAECLSKEILEQESSMLRACVHQVKIAGAILNSSAARG